MKTSPYASMAGVALDDIMKASAEMDTWIDKSPYDMGSENSPFYKRFKDTFYGYYEKNPGKGLRFSNAMTAWTLSTSQLPLAFCMGTILTVVP
jgi:hypothetical protein